MPESGDVANGDLQLYGFGSNVHSLFSDHEDAENASATAKILVPKHILSGKSVQILWASWCDALISYQSISSPIPAMPPTIQYTGMGLTETQLAKVEEASQTTTPIFFGADLQSGLQGFITANNITIFPPSPATSEISTYPQPASYQIQAITINSGGRVNVVTTPLTPQEENNNETPSLILQFPSLTHLQSSLGSPESLPSPLLTLPPNQPIAQILSNATTTTLLTRTGKVYTWTCDPRYPACLGRASDSENPASVPHPIPYFSETKIVKIASGGYMSAAISEAGELFIWGMGCPGSEGSLAVFKKKGADEDEDGDEFVKCVEIELEGRVARVVDVAVGWGHVLVAVQGDKPGLRAVFVAGQGESGQLGVGRMEFVEEFREVRGFRGRKVRGLHARGWSSWVVVEG